MASVSLRGEWRGAVAALSARRVGRFYLDNTQDATRANHTYGVIDVSGNVPLPVVVPRRRPLTPRVDRAR